MSSPLTKDSLMECTRHGLRKPAFICQHLQYGENTGFFESVQVSDSEWPFKNAWCAKCEAFATEQGGWNDVSEAFAKVMVICEGCYEDIQQRNKQT